MNYKLYLKTHNKTGLKYLGYTKCDNPEQYSGSGKYWKRHLKKHGNDVTTEILFETKSKEELKLYGIKLSKQYDIVNSSDFANLRIEEGDGGWDGIHTSLKHDLEFKEKFSNSVSKGVKQAHKDGKLKGWPTSGNFKGKKHSVKSRRKISENNRMKMAESEIQCRINDINDIEKCRGWITKLSKKWNVSHTQVRRFIKTHLPQVLR